MALSSVTSLLGFAKYPSARIWNFVPVLSPSFYGLEQRRSYAMRQELREHGIIWRRPEYIPSWKPSKSGDMEALPKANLSRPIPRVSAAKEAFEGADEITKKLLSLEFSPHKETVKTLKSDALKKIQQHKYETGSMECTIAMLTVKIRNLQQVVARCKKDVHAKVMLQETIARRKKLLKFLRAMDYKRFEWLLEQLNILYRPYPVHYHWITRKDSLRKLIQMHKETLKIDRLEAYKAILETQKEPFLKEKEETLEWIAKTEKELSVPVSVDNVKRTKLMR
ncbi:putative universal ribosomal protein uS15 [Halocaridina rubra]|uniref:Small ribosomal subunit protein uS15m n=1 Tax=Halocaridina rubra TaxID=373956 RepID=A0AAN8WE44_HALRR